jgi:hypothetical protein
VASSVSTGSPVSSACSAMRVEIGVHGSFDFQTIVLVQEQNEPSFRTGKLQGVLHDRLQDEVEVGLCVEKTGQLQELGVGAFSGERGVSCRL